MTDFASGVTCRVGRNLWYYRKRLGLTTRDLFNVSGVAPSTISRIERGQQNVTVETLAKLASVLGVSAAALVEVNFEADRYHITNWKKGNR